LILAGLKAQGITKITEPSLSRNHSEIMLTAMKAPLSVKNLSVSVTAAKTLSPIDLDVPGDMSSAAFFVAAALMTKNSHLKICDVGVNATRTGFLNVVKKMGGQVQVLNRKKICGEEVADIEVKSSILKNITVGGGDIPLLIDEIPVLALVGASATGEMVVKDAEELRVKETDRIQAICSELSKMGVLLRESKDGFVVQGLGDSQKLKTPLQNFKSYGDHRMAMTECVAGMMLSGSIEIDDISCVNTSFPGFFDLLKGWV
jgi:3-phosphoshikimate 1-carboxyvinyltransferase